MPKWEQIDTNSAELVKAREEIKAGLARTTVDSIMADVLNQVKGQKTENLDADSGLSVGEQKFLSKLEAEAEKNPEAKEKIKAAQKFLSDPEFKNEMYASIANSMENRLSWARTEQPLMGNKSFEELNPDVTPEQKKAFLEAMEAKLKATKSLAEQYENKYKNAI